MTYDTETAADDSGLKTSVQQSADSGSGVMTAGTTFFAYNRPPRATGSSPGTPASADARGVA